MALVCGALLLGGCPKPDPRIERARLAVGALKLTLQRELQAAMKQGGPTAAIEVCGKRATEIQRQASTGGVAVGRSSHRLRNPDNATPAWAEPLLKQLLAAEKRSPLSVTLPDGKLGYVEPLLTQPVCETCHGKKIADALLAQLKKRYPKDQATGFAEGHVRGIAWAVVP